MNTLPSQILERCTSPYWTSQQWIHPKTLPTRPHAIFSTLQGTQNPDTKPTLQRAKNAFTQPFYSFHVIANQLNILSWELFLILNRKQQEGSREN